ncbi:hypothetical protein R1flu_000653 [Riccia fluitans]|uniref:C2 domain-containing protein n=1 Tax=Riccia fluitans TaxID=41844 RepID=A0ABD1Y189_9MARC
MGRNKYKLFASTIAEPSYAVINDDLILQEQEAYRHCNKEPMDLDMDDQDTYGNKKDEEDYHDDDQDPYQETIAKEEAQQEKDIFRTNKEIELQLEKDPYRDIIRELGEKQSQDRGSHDPCNKRHEDKHRNEIDLSSYRNKKKAKLDEGSYMFVTPNGHGRTGTSSVVGQLGECTRGVMQMEVHMASGIKGSYLLGQVKTSPYVTVKYGHDKKELRSSVDRVGGPCPAWNETFFYNVMNPAHRPPLLHIEIWDQLVARKDKLLGRVSLDNVLEYVCKNPSMCTQHMWLPVFRHRKKDHSVRERGKLLVRFWFESKDATYFGDARWREDHTYSRNKEKKSIDMTDTGIVPKYRVLPNILVEQYMGTVIRLDVSDLQ